jgi:hypothetical protein
MECAKVVIANKTRELKNEKHIGQWSSTLETYIYPTLGDLTISTITKVAMLKLSNRSGLRRMKQPDVSVVV